MHVDIEKFWEDDEKAHKDNCFSPEAPQVALGIRMSEECIYAELGIEGNPWRELPRDLRIKYNKLYNDKAEKIVGRRLLQEDFPEPDAVFPEIRDIGEVFGSQYVDNGHSMWLPCSCSTPSELEKILDKAESIDIRSFILPNNWESEKRRIFEKYGRKPDLWRGVRGPVTLATSIYGPENLIYLILDEPDLALRFSNVIADVICNMIEAMDEEAGYKPGETPHGFSFSDDNCCLLTLPMYEFFGFPILKRVFDRWCPDPSDNRYQHSDSDMAHLLPALARLNLTGCNFGPTVLVDKIREYMPATRISGCLAPFTFMHNDEGAIIEEVKRDCRMAKVKRGLELNTAGSINNGSLLSSMKAVMFAIQNYGRYL